MAFARCLVLAIFTIISTSVHASKDVSIKCVPVTLKSYGGRPVNKVIVDDANVPQEIQNVAVSIQLSKLKCVDGINYFHQRSFIIVKGGCAAVFKVCYKKTVVATTAAPLTTVQPGCSKVRLLSRKARPVSKDVDGSVSSMRLLKNLHDKVLCEEGVNFRFKGRTVFAEGGCRGDFEVCTEVAALTTPASELTCRKVTLKSTHKYPSQERVTDSKGEDADLESVTLIRQISSSVHCKKGYNYFVFGSSIIAKQGCQACFRVCYRDRPTTAAPLTTTPLPEQCRQYKVFRPLRRIVLGENGSPATVTSVILVKEISKHVCREGVNYFFRDSLFVVNGGCKGIFKVFYEEERPAPLTTPVPDKIVCRKVDVKSVAHRPGRVDIADEDGNPVDIVHVHVWDQISEIKCVQWVNYFFTESFIVAKDGCQATFKVCYKEKRKTTTPAPLTTTPEPEICRKYKVLKPTRETIQGENALPVDITSVVLEREISRHVCKEGVNYLFEGSDFIVNGGCKGVFTVCYRERTTTPAPLTTTERPTITCKRVDAKSDDNRNGRVDVVDAHGNPVDIVHVHVWDQISEVKCVEWVNYFYFENFIVAKKGCGATFKICYKEKRKPTTTPAPLTTTPQPEICKKFKVLKPIRETIQSENSLPVDITSVVLEREISRHVCKEGVNYFFEGSDFVVTGGCKGVFTVCYKERRTTPAPLTTTPQPEICKKYKVLRPIRETIQGENSLPVDITSVVLRKEISYHVCKEGVNYLFEGSDFIVNGGCKGIFTVCYKERRTTPAPLTTTEKPTIVCKRVDVESKYHRPGRVDVVDAHDNPVEIVHVHVWDQISEIKCVEWVNYFYFESYIVAKKGCGATFKVCYKENRKPTTTPAPLTTTPEPEICMKYKVLRPIRETIQGENSLPVDITSVVLRKEISYHVCKEGVNYLFEGSDFIVNGGCKGIFTVCYKERSTTPAPLTTTEKPTIVCKRVDVESKYHRPGRVDVVDAHDNPVEIVHVHVWDQISEVKCVEWVNYFYFESYIVAKKGCGATFKVCYKEKRKPTTTPAPLTTTPQPEICKKFKVLKPTRETIQGENSLPVDITSVVLEREISRHVCKEGVNYFFEGSDFVVTGGCKGVFTVCYKERRTTPAPLTTTPEPEICKKYKILRPIRETIQGENSLPVDITSVVLNKEISYYVCKEGVNYLFEGSDFIVNGGCKGIFTVCYKERRTTPAPLTTTEKPTIVCKQVDVESKYYRPGRVDVVDAHGSPVEIVHVHVWDQISEVKCVEWVNYFYFESYIVAKAGCGATFKVCYKENRKPTTTPAPLTTTPQPEICRKYKVLRPTRESIQGENSLPVDITSVVLEREISRHVCKEGVNYFFEGSEFVVTGGCKGVFTVCYKERRTTPAPLTTTPQPEICKKYKVLRPIRETIEGENSLPVDITSVVLRKEISYHVCKEGVNYLFEGSDFIVNGGCKGIFTVCYKERRTTPAPLTTTEKPTIVCKRVDVESKYQRPGRVDVVDAHDNPVEIVHVHVWDQISEIKCVEWVNYFYFESYIVAKAGCGATFKVCYKEKRKPTTTPAPLTTTPEPEICRKYKVLKPTRESIQGENSLPVDITSVVLEREISRHVCKEGVNYFFDGSDFVVNGGCKGVFTVCYKERRTTPAPLTTTPQPEICKKFKVLKTTRESIEGENSLPVDITRIVLEKEISYYVCKEGVNYLFEGSDFVVNGGCKGIFTVCYKERRTTPAPLTTTEKPTIVCKRVDVESKYHRPGRVDVVDAHDNPVEIVHVHVWDQISEVKCVEWVNYFYFESYIVAKAGCGATFKVCYKENRKPTTTPAPLTTTPQPEICKKYKILRPLRETIQGENSLPVDITSIVLEKEISYYVCKEGVNYLFEGSDLVVNGGCKGIFTVCYKERSTTPAPLTTTAPKPKTECLKLVLEGTGPKPDSRVIQSPGTGSVTITNIDLITEFSHKICKEWISYFAAGNIVSARNGCKGVFKVCFSYYYK